MFAALVKVTGKLKVLKCANKLKSCADLEIAYGVVGAKMLLYFIKDEVLP